MSPFFTKTGTLILLLLSALQALTVKASPLPDKVPADPGFGFIYLPTNGTMSVRPSTSTMFMALLVCLVFLSQILGTTATPVPQGDFIQFPGGAPPDNYYHPPPQKGSAANLKVPSLHIVLVALIMGLFAISQLPIVGARPLPGEQSEASAEKTEAGCHDPPGIANLLGWKCLGKRQDINGKPMMYGTRFGPPEDGHEVVTELPGPVVDGWIEEFPTHLVLNENGTVIPELSWGPMPSEIELNVTHKRQETEVTTPTIEYSTVFGTPVNGHLPVVATSIAIVNGKIIENSTSEASGTKTADTYAPSLQTGSLMHGHPAYMLPPGLDHAALKQNGFPRTWMFHNGTRCRFFESNNTRIHTFNCTDSNGNIDFDPAAFVAAAWQDWAAKQNRTSESQGRDGPTSITAPYPTSKLHIERAPASDFIPVSAASSFKSGLLIKLAVALLVILFGAQSTASPIPDQGPGHPLSIPAPSPTPTGPPTVWTCEEDPNPGCTSNRAGSTTRASMAMGAITVALMLFSFVAQVNASPIAAVVPNGTPGQNVWQWSPYPQCTEDVPGECNGQPLPASPSNSQSAGNKTSSSLPLRAAVVLLMLFGFAAQIRAKPLPVAGPEPGAAPASKDIALVPTETLNCEWTELSATCQAAPFNYHCDDSGNLRFSQYLALCETDCVCIATGEPDDKKTQLITDRFASPQSSDEHESFSPSGSLVPRTANDGWSLTCTNASNATTCSNLPILMSCEVGGTRKFYGEYLADCEHDCTCVKNPHLPTITTTEHVPRADADEDGAPSSTRELTSREVAPDKWTLHCHNPPNQSICPGPPFNFYCFNGVLWCDDCNQACGEDCTCVQT